MSEQLDNEPNNNEIEPAPMFDDCLQCEERYEITKDNTTGVFYEKMIDCSYLKCTCPNCKFVTQIFIGENTIDNCYLADIPMDRQDFADEETFNSIHELRGGKPLKTYDLTPRHEQLIGSFATTLAACPDDLLYDLITAGDQGRPHPEKWID